MKAKKPTKAETEWLDELESILLRCPSKRLVCYTVGDCYLAFYDWSVAREWERKNPNSHYDAGMAHEKAGSLLRIIDSNFQIDSCAG